MTETLPRYVLRHENQWGERHFFIRLGNPWPHRPELRLIERTTSDRAQATVFDTLTAALEVLVTAGDPPGWIAMTEDGKLVE